MHYLTDDDFRTLVKAEELETRAYALMEEWKNIAKLASNEKEYSATRPKFEQALLAHNEWREYFDKECTKLLPAIIK